MAIRRKDFELIASSIRRIRSQLQTDLDGYYAENGAIVLDRLAEQLADDCAARYAHFEREAFLRASQVRQSLDHLADGASGTPRVGSRLVASVGRNVPADPFVADTHSIDGFEGVTSAKKRELLP